jgi:signal transduction histidine kinase
MRRWWKAMLPALAVLLPALVLAFLGLRSYEAEQVLAESRFKRSIRSIADLMASGLEESALAAIRDLVDMARSGIPSDVGVERVRSRHPLVGQVFILGRQGELLYPALSKRQPERRRQSAVSVIASASAATARPGANLFQEVAVYHRRVKREMEARRLLATAELAEVRGRRGRAYKAYRAVARRSARLAPAAYLGMARVAVAEGRWQDAAYAQSVLVQRYGIQLDWAGVPYALIGRVGLFTVATRCRAVGPKPARPSRSVRSIRTVKQPCPKGLGDPQGEALRLYTDLVHDRLRTELRTRIYFIDWIRKRIRPPATPELRRSLAELDASVGLLRVGIRFAAALGRTGAEAIVRQAGYRPRALRSNAFRRGRALVVVQSLGSMVVGFVLRQDQLNQNLRKLQGRKQLPEGYTVQLQRLPLREDLRPLPSHVRSLDEVLGDLGLAIFGSDRKERGLLASGVAQYLGLVAGLVFVLVAGMLTMYRGVRQEMELARLKSEFVSNVSHELKTPLTSIRMFGEMLQQGLATDRRKRSKYYGIIVAESDRLGRLINNVLDFSRMERGTKTYDFEAHFLADLAREAVETFGHFREAEEFELKLEVLEEPEVLVDRDAVVQSLINLLTNAVKYSGDARRILVRVYGRTDSGVLEVTDQGIGIPKKEQRRIFEDFYRASNVRQGGAEGTGLGLALVRRHCLNMGGSVEMESTLGSGSTFRMVFPALGTPETVTSE